jgi:rod shape determining protein RodA
MSWKAKAKHFDLGLVLLLLVLSFMGIMALWSASHGAGGQLVAGYALRQLRWLGLGLVAMGIFAAIDYRYLQTNAYAIYVVLVVMLVLVLTMGKASMGAQRWLMVGPLRVQPSEFMKIGIAIAVAHVYTQSWARPPYTIKALIWPGIITAIPVGLIVVQPDLGTAILVMGVALSITAFQGVRRKVVGLCTVLMLAGAPLFWSVLKGYQRARILTFLDPERDPTGAGYHIIQSKIAIGSGQLLGKGYMKGTQSHLRFLPERHTDFIFSVLAEEWGFVGTMLVLGLFMLLLFWGLDIAAKAKDTFGRLLAVGLTSILFLHVVVNIGMVAGLLPVVGVPLPLFSYGGSSVLTTFVIAGILLSIRLRRFSR